MISRQKRPAKRRAAAAVVFGSAVAVLASPLALGSAAAATPVTNVTVTSTANAPAGGNATINVHYDPAQDPAVPIDYTVLGGIAGDTDAAFAGHDCVSNTNGTAVCTVHNSGTAGTDNVRVFADENNNDVWDGGEKSADTNVVFAGPIDKITLTSPTSSATNTCAQFTAHVTDSNGKGAAGRDVKLTVNETATATPGSDPITYYAGGCSGSTSTATNDVSGNNITFTHTVTVPTDNSGDVVFGLSSSAPGTANVIVASAANANIKDQDTVSFGPGGTNGVANVTVTSATTVTNYTGTTADFTVKATNGSGNPVQGVTVNKQTNSGPDTLAPTPCGTTNASGTVTCSITNGGTAGTDQLTFWVDNDADGAHTSGPDANEPKTTATAVFIAQPVVSGANSNVTCEQQLAGPNQGNAVGTCTLPTSQHSVVFTAKVADASNDPIQGAVVTFTATSAKLGGATVSGANLPTGTATTNANGVATFTVNNPNAANGDNVTVSAKVGAQAVGDATANWAGAQATELTVTPELQSVTNGGTVTVTAKVTDQFGNPVAGSPNITYTVTGRNAGKNGSAAADGTITYQDTNVNPGSDTDTISVIDNTHAFHATATVNFITGPATPSTVTVDTSGAGTTNTTCAIAGHNPATGVALQGTTEVCAVVKNANDEPLAGQSVTFTVSNGQVAAVGALSANSGTTYHATTDAKGVAFADVTSTTSGAQTVTATAGSVSGTGTVTYLNPTPAQAKSITVDPETVTITPGGSQKFTATVKDQFGNPVGGVVVGYTQSGTGTISGSSSGQLTTAADGTVSVTLTTPAGSTGSGSVTFSIGSAPTVPNQCATVGGNCTATATYTVANTAPTRLVLDGEHGAKVGTHETVRAAVKNADGTPSPNQVVRFFVSGANDVTGTATTDAAGNAKFVYALSHHGKDTIAAYVDVNNDQIRTADEPKDSIVRHIRGIEHPKLSLNSKNGKVKIHVNTRPNAKHALVRYYVKRHGSWEKIGSSHTNRKGNDNHKFKFKVGSKHKFRAKVSATATTTKGTSNKASIRVRR